MKIKSKIYPFIIPIALPICLIVLSNVVFASKTEENKVLNFALEKVIIKSKEKILCEFYVEIADTKEKRQKGLMYRKLLYANQGMLFDFKGETKVSFWMKDTLIPLDIIFIDQKGYIVNIYENAIPLSTKSINSVYQVRAALEVNAGLVKKLNINIGDRVIYKIFREG